MAVKNLYFKGPQVAHVNENSDPIDISLNKYVDHPSTFKIKEYFNKPTECNFWEVTPNDIKKEIKNLDHSKKGTFKNITPKSLKGEIYVRHFEIYGPKKLYEKGLFQRITPFLKKENPLLVENYRPGSVLPTASRIYERIMWKQIIYYIKQYLFLCYVNTEKASLHKRLCFISLKNGTLCLIKKNT